MLVGDTTINGEDIVVRVNQILPLPRVGVGIKFVLGIGEKNNDAYSGLSLRIFTKKVKKLDK